MTYVITSACCNDSSCVPVCPVQCIRPLPGDPDFSTSEQLYIDPATCIDCGACMEECPVDAIHPQLRLPESLADCLEVNAAYFRTRPIEQSRAPDPVRRLLPPDRQSLLVAVVGSGPAACYATEELSAIKGVTVSLLERLPTPFGLVRAGVAPDHQATKQIANRFGSVLARPNVRCFFNVEVGRDITIAELLQHHHAVLWAGGADDSRRLGIPGEDLAGSYPARRFVAWYNGHPDAAEDTFDLSGGRVVVIGNGNVALDVARVLARPVSALASTDIADHALDALAVSRVTDVVVAARRGPERAAYTTGELLALERTDGIALRAIETDLASASLAGDRRSAAVAAALKRGVEPGQRSVTLRYGLRPVAINGAESVESVTFERADGSAEVVEAGLVLSAIGYRGRAVVGLPFDDATGTLPNEQGRVHNPGTGLPVVGVYCAGWIKRGATGVIGSNKTDSAESVAALLHDFETGQLDDPLHGSEQLAELLSRRAPDRLEMRAWASIDRRERLGGREAGRPRRKLVRWADLIRAARST